MKELRFYETDLHVLDCDLNNDLNNALYYENYESGSFVYHQVNTALWGEFSRALCNELEFDIER